MLKNYHYGFCRFMPGLVLISVRMHPDLFENVMRDSGNDHYVKNFLFTDIFRH